MKKFLKYVGIFFGVMFIISVIAVTAERFIYGPTHSFIFLNTSNEERSITFNKIFADGTVERMYTIDTILKPNKFVYTSLIPDNYQIRVWHADSTLVDSFNLKVELKDTNSSETNPYRIDLALDKVFAIVNLNALYENSIFSYSKNESLKLAKLYDGKGAFMIDKQYTMYKFMDINDDLPSSIKARQTLYGLFAVADTLPEANLLENIFEQLKPKMDL